MQEVRGLVTIVIPAYNAENFLKETIDSVKKQTYTDWAIIVVDDGSTDATAALVMNDGDSRISLIQQQNAGVSAARNNGLQKALGEYVVFLDADDVMTDKFIETRVNFLKQNPDYGFVGGLIETFPVRTITKKSAANDPEKEILFFETDCGTTPSAYMFRKKTLLEHGIRFNTKLNSTADRFFILQLAKFTKGRRIEGEDSKLLYRVHEQSMSHNMNPALILDNVQFYKELKRENLLPGVNTAKFKSQFFYSLGVGFAKVKHFGSFIKYTWYSFISSPIYFMKLTFKKKLFKK